MQIQAEEKSTFDKSFISIRFFHLEMAFFFCPGKSHWRIRWSSNSGWMQNFGQLIRFWEEKAINDVKGWMSF